MPSSLNGTGVTFNDGTTLQSGNIPAANLGSGTANSTTFLRGDRTWQTINTTPTTDQVLAATAGASEGAVGTYSFLSPTTKSDYSIGATFSGSSLRYTSVTGRLAFQAGIRQSGTPSGTWRAMSAGSGTGSWSEGDVRAATLFLRIS